MSHAKKLVAGVAVIAVAAGAALPGMTGYILENTIQDKVEAAAEKYDFSVSSVELNRGFSETTIAVTLEGEGVRKLSRESLELSGSIQHNALFELPELMTTDLNFTYYTYQQGIQLGLPGTVQGAVSWDGAMVATINTKSLEVPLDPMGAATLLLQPASGTLKAGRTDQNVDLSLKPLNWTLFDNGEQQMSVAVEPSEISISPSGEAWTMQIPAVSLNTTEIEDHVDLTLEDLRFEGEQTTVDQQLSSSLTMSAGQLTIPALEPLHVDKVIEGFTLSSSAENINESAIPKLAVLMKEGTQMGNEEAVEQAAEAFLMDLMAGNPGFALDEFTLNTANGDLAIAFAMAGTDRSRDTLNTILDAQGLTPAQSDKLAYEFMMGMDSSARIALSDELVDWSCQRIGEQAAVEQGATAAEGEFIAGMCKTMADSGEFLSVPCMEIANPQWQGQCMDTMRQVKVVWAESKTLEVAVKDGQLLLNGVEVELPVAM